MVPKANKVSVHGFHPRNPLYDGYLNRQKRETKNKSVAQNSFFLTYIDTPPSLSTSIVHRDIFGGHSTHTSEYRRRGEFFYAVHLQIHKKSDKNGLNGKEWERERADQRIFASHSQSVSSVAIAMPPPPCYYCTVQYPDSPSTSSTLVQYMCVLYSHVLPPLPPIAQTSSCLGLDFSSVLRSVLYSSHVLVHTVCGRTCTYMYVCKYTILYTHGIGKSFPLSWLNPLFRLKIDDGIYRNWKEVTYYVYCLICTGTYSIGNVCAVLLYWLHWACCPTECSGKIGISSSTHTVRREMRASRSNFMKKGRDEM